MSQKKTAAETPQDETSEKKSESTTSSTETPPQKTIEELLGAIARNIADTNGMFEDLVDLAITDPKFIPPEVRISSEDLTLLYSVQMISGSKTMMHLKGRQDLPMALHPSQAQSALRKFQQVFTAVIGEPLAARLQHHLTEVTRAVEDNHGYPPAQMALPQQSRQKPQAHQPPEEDDERGGFIAPSIPD
jgi:hypothetical protein